MSGQWRDKHFPRDEAGVESHVCELLRHLVLTNESLHSIKKSTNKRPLLRVLTNERRVLTNKRPLLREY